jgi:hypothetical protein
MLCYKCFLVKEHNELCILEKAIRQKKEEKWRGEMRREVERKGVERREVE